MTAFKVCFFVTCLVFLFSCEERKEEVTPTTGVIQRRIFVIKEIKKIIPNNSFVYYSWGDYAFFEVTLKNISNFDLHLHYEKRRPLLFVPRINYILFYNNEKDNFLGIGERFFEDDTSRLIKKGEVFAIRVPCWIMPESKFREYEYLRVNFELMMSTSNDLSFYFESNPSKPKYESQYMNDGTKAYYYPLGFTYLISKEFFWEHHLLE